MNKNYASKCFSLKKLIGVCYKILSGEKDTIMIKLPSTFFIGLISIFLILSCTEEDIPRVELNLDCLYDNIEMMNTIIDTSQFGIQDGTYPVESADNLQLAIADLQYGVSLASADRFTLQYEIDNYCVAAAKEITSFENSLQITLDPGTPAELRVFGIDQLGRVEFGESPDFVGSDGFSVESWIKYDEGFYEFAIGNFLSTFSSGEDLYEGWMINFMGANLRATIGMGPQFLRVLEFGSIYPDNYGEWNHIVMVYDASLPEYQLKMYLNGTVFFAKTNDIFDGSGVIQSYSPNTVNMNMWAFMEPTDHNRCMTGYIKKFRYWDYAISQDEVVQNMDTDVTGSESGLVCAWDFGEMPEDVEDIPDKTGNHTAKIVGKHKWYPIN